MWSIAIDGRGLLTVSSGTQKWRFLLDSLWVLGGWKTQDHPGEQPSRNLKKSNLDRRAAHLTFELRVYCMNDCTTNNLHVPYVPQRPNAPCAHRWSIVLIAVVIKEFSRRSIYLKFCSRHLCIVDHRVSFQPYLFAQCSSLVLLYYISSAIPTHSCIHV